MDRNSTSRTYKNVTKIQLHKVLWPSKNLAHELRISSPEFEFATAHVNVSFLAGNVPVKWLQLLMKFPAVNAQRHAVPEPGGKISLEPWPERDTCDDPDDVVLVPGDNDVWQTGLLCVNEVPDEFVDEGEEVGSYGRGQNRYHRRHGGRSLDTTKCGLLADVQDEPEFFMLDWKAFLWRGGQLAYPCR